ncbi:MAG TPA: C39 family peptidase [Chloroflexia bacterium]|nr:C39 family peptidase [Chloroflexia bacterium]
MTIPKSLPARRGLSWLAILLLASLCSPLITTSHNVEAADLRQSNLWLNASAAEFNGWQRDGIIVSGDNLQLDQAHLKAGHDPYAPGSFSGGNYYNGGNYSYGEALGPYYSPPGGFDSAVVSWNASTPAGTWVELKLRALIGTRWTREYVMGVWSSENGTIKRHSVNGQADGDGRVDTDTLNLKARASAFQVRAVLFTTNPSVTPTVSLVAVSAVHNGSNPAIGSNRAAWGVDLAVPERSQMIYPDGGEVWCSPTSTSMVLAYWASKANRPELNQTVPSAAAHTLDWIYQGNGNWPFNTAYAASFGNIEAYVTRMLSLSQVESWISQGVPVIVSIAYQPGQLSGTPIPASDGHLIVIRGFDRAGNVITNDPAGNPNRGQSVRIVYNRAQFEQRWLSSSGGTAYLVYPRNFNPPEANRNGSWNPGNTKRLSGFADPAIENTWASADQAVAAGGNSRSWLWGPQPNTPALLENYVEGPGGQRVVQYFDKSRMEITKPQGDRGSQWFVTNGLLTVELVSGSMQVGDNLYRAGTPAQIPVAGDPTSDNAPTYATFRPIASVEGHQSERRAANRTGQPVTASLDRSGNQGQRSNDGVKVAYYEPTLGHNIPDVFWSWMNNPARSGLSGGWLFALGYPISDPYWVEVKVNGAPRTVLVQLFERRALTYTPGNPAAFLVEMGNIGQHYYAWRYR